MLARSPLRNIDHHRGVYLLGRRDRPHLRAALAVKARAGVRVKILLDAIGSSTIGNDILETSNPAAASSPGTTRSTGTRSAGSTTGRIGKSLIIDGRVGFTGGAGIADPWLGHAQTRALARHADPGRRSGRDAAADRLRPELAGTTGELVSGPMYYPPVEPAGTLVALTLMSSPVTGASTVRTMYYLSIICAQRVNLDRQPLLRARPAAIDTLIEAKQRGVDVQDHGVRIEQRQLAVAPQQRSALWPPARAPGSRSTSTTTRCCTTRRWWSTESGPPSARPISTTARLRTTRRATSASTTKMLAERMEATYRTT